MTYRCAVHNNQNFSMLCLECVYFCPSLFSLIICFRMQHMRSVELCVDEGFPNLFTLSGATDCMSVFVFIRPSVCPLRFALMGQNFVSVWRIHFKVITLIHWDEETDTIFRTQILSFFFFLCKLIFSYFF